MNKTRHVYLLTCIIPGDIIQIIPAVSQYFTLELVLFKYKKKKKSLHGVLKLLNFPTVGNTAKQFEKSWFTQCTVKATCPSRNHFA
jgi:hypothetical protein